MKKIIFAFIILLLLIPTIKADLFPATTSFNCNDYQVNMKDDKYIYFCNPNTETNFTSYWSYVSGTPKDISSIKITNSNTLMYAFSEGAWRNFAFIPNVCTGAGNNTCSFYIVSLGSPMEGACVRNATHPYSQVIQFQRYANVCSPPELNILTPLPNGTIGVGGYLFNFSITNSVGWSNVICNLNLTGLNSFYTTSFNTSTTTPFVVQYSKFPKQFTTARVVCTYTNEVGNSEIFILKGWLVDYAIPYNISDISILPYNLYPYQTLDFIFFRIVSMYDQTPYPSAVHVILSSSSNLTALNCSRTTNITRDYPNANIYSFAPSLTCNNSATVTFNITAYDQASLLLISSTLYNVTWNTGGMSIDNINLMINSSGSLQLWATVSNDYTHTPIPDIAGLSCNYSADLVSLIATDEIEGAMDEYRTYDGSLNLIQTDMRNTTLVNTTPEYVGRIFDLQINCSADGYADKSISTRRWVGSDRLLTFKCIPSTTATSNILNNQLYYGSLYETDTIYIRCIATTDGDYPQFNSFFFPLEHVDFNLISNMNGDMLSSCKNLVGMYSYSFDNSDANVYFAFTSTLHKWDQYCSGLIQLQEEKISKGLVMFSMNDAGSIYNSTITPTTADLTFDLKYLPSASLVNNALAFLENKTPPIVEDGDQLVCITTIQDPSKVVTNVQHFYYNKDDPQGIYSSCITPQVSSKKEGNNTYTYASYLQINADNCPFFTVSNLTGHIVCKAIVQQSYKLGKQEQLSNDFLFITPTSETGGGYGTGKNQADVFGGIGSLIGAVINPLLAWALSNPLAFMLLFLLGLGLILFMLAFSKFVETIRKSLSDGGG